jgi:RNA polymerase sigma-70 factor (ECF subfamily)
VTKNDSSTPVDESWVVLHAQSGSRAHVEALMLIAQRFLAPRVRALFDEPADAEDTLQDVLFAICRRVGSLNDPRLFRPWAHRIAMRAAWRSIDRIRRRDRTRDEDVDPDALADASPTRVADDVTELLVHVSPASRVVMSLHYIEGLTLEATAAELGVAPGTVKSRLAYGLQQLRAARLRDEP